MISCKSFKTNSCDHLANLGLLLGFYTIFADAEWAENLVYFWPQKKLAFNYFHRRQNHIVTLYWGVKNMKMIDQGTKEFWTSCVIE